MEQNSIAQGDIFKMLFLSELIKYQRFTVFPDIKQLVGLNDFFKNIKL